MTRAQRVLSRDLDLYNEFWAIARGEDSCSELQPEGRWVVIEHTPGYLPDSDEPALFDRLDEAVAYLREEVQRYIEHLNEVGEVVTVAIDPAGRWAMVNMDGSGLGRVFDVLEAEEEIE